MAIYINADMWYISTHCFHCNVRNKKIQVMMWVGRKTFFIHIQIFVSNFAYVKNSSIVETNVYLTLKFPDLATDDEGNEGFWTLIYNQVL